MHVICSRMNHLHIVDAKEKNSPMYLNKFIIRTFAFDIDSETLCTHRRPGTSCWSSIIWPLRGRCFTQGWLLRGAEDLERLLLQSEVFAPTRPEHSATKKKGRKKKLVHCAFAEESSSMWPWIPSRLSWERHLWQESEFQCRPPRSSSPVVHSSRSLGVTLFCNLEGFWVNFTDSANEKSWFV